MARPLPTDITPNKQRVHAALEGKPVDRMPVGVMYRLEQIASTGADGLAPEAGMKNYTNDIDEIAAAIGDRISLFGNINPYDTIERASDDDLAAEVARQAAAGRKARGFIMCTGSPITPGTPLARVRRFIKLAGEA